MKIPDVQTPVRGFAWIGPQGQWLTYYESTTHTGTHKVLGETNDLSKAFVGHSLPRYNESNGVLTEQYTAIPAEVVVVRTVKLVKAAAQ